MENRRNILSNYIVERKNGFFEEVKKMKACGESAYIYGGGSAGVRISKELKEIGFEHSGFVVDRKYYEHNKNILCLEDTLENSKEKVNLIIANSGNNFEKLKSYTDKIGKIICYDIVWGNYVIDNEYMTYDWVTEHIEQLQHVYEQLQDDLSKETFVAYINQKISRKYGYMQKVKSNDAQYFEKEIIKLKGEEVFVDCGGFIGDTAQNFVNEIDEQGVGSYDSIISFEPDIINYEKMCALNLNNHICINKGTSEIKETLHFSSNGSAGVIDENGELSIETETIDSVLNGGRATFIKMDIEGFELASLKGGAKTIRKYKPTLAICIYHKKQDLYEIPEYIHLLVPEYKFFVRAYHDAAIELVLYAII